MSERLARLRAELERIGAASFLVSHPVNVRYLTGFESSNAVAVVDRDRVVVGTDGRYVEAARALEGVEVFQLERELARDLSTRLGDLAEPPVAFEADHLTVAQHELVAEAGLELAPVTGVVQGLRAVKEAGELDAVRRAARILTNVFERLAGELVVGRSEAEVAWLVALLLHEEGAEAPAFDAVVATGPNAALPHHHPGGRRIERGDVVLVDAGARVDGYCSDCTRTFCAGSLSEDLRRAYAVCRRAQEAALAEVRAGVEARRPDAVARERLEEAALAPVLHGVGHGVGLEVHEQPRLSRDSEATLAAGQVVTVEPGVYLPGSGGIRIEDLAVVTEEGAEVLTPFTKDLVVLD